MEKLQGKQAALVFNLKVLTMQYELTNLEKLLLRLSQSIPKPDDISWYTGLLEEKERILTAFGSILKSTAGHTARYRKHHHDRLEGMKGFISGMPQAQARLIANTLDDLILSLDAEAAPDLPLSAKTGKAHINMSVQELAMLSRVLWELRIVSADFKADIIRLVTQHFTTKGAGRKEPISEQHFRRRMSTASTQSCDTLRRILKAVLSRVDELKVEAIHAEKESRNGRLAIE